MSELPETAPPAASCAYLNRRTSLVMSAFRMKMVCWSIACIPSRQPEYKKNHATKGTSDIVRQLTVAVHASLAPWMKMMKKTMLSTIHTQRWIMRTICILWTYTFRMASGSGANMLSSSSQ